MTVLEEIKVKLVLSNNIKFNDKYYLLYCKALLSGSYRITYVPYNQSNISYSHPDYDHDNLLDVIHEDLNFCIQYIKYELLQMSFGNVIEEIRG